MIKWGDKDFLFKKKVEHIVEKAYPSLYRSRYGMVTYTLIPYHKAKEAGEIQAEIITELCLGLESPEEVNLTLAHELIESKLTPWLAKNNLSIERFKGI